MSCADYRDKILGWGCDFQNLFLQWLLNYSYAIL